MAELDPPLFVFGGIAEDALLDHQLSRPHSDIDVMVLRDELSQRLVQCETLGFKGFEVYYEPIRDKPLVLGGRKGSLNLELGIWGFWIETNAAITSPSPTEPVIFTGSTCPTTCLRTPSP
jgi:hypothetical protein